MNNKDIKCPICGNLDVESEDYDFDFTFGCEEVKFYCEVCNKHFVQTNYYALIESEVEEIKE